MSPARAIIHVDMDAFYAAVEQLDQPRYRGQPLIVAGVGPRSVVTTASYEARVFGVRSAMPTAQARRLCPQGIYVAPRMARYVEISRQVFAVFAEVTPEIEGLSLDEAFLDVGASLRLFGGIEAIGRYLKQEIKQHTGLSASVGMAHNKLLAKLAGELSKPDGLLHILPDAVQAWLDPLPVGRLWTVGKVAEAALHRLGIRTVRDLRLCDSRRLQRALGAHAVLLQRLACGEDERKVEAEVEEKSLSAEHTFDSDIRELDLAQAWLLRLCERVGQRLRERAIKGRTLTLKLRKPPFETMTRQCRMPIAVDATDAIYRQAKALLGVWWASQDAPALRLLGVGLSGFGAGPQDDLFVPDLIAPRDELADRINRRFGARSLQRAGSLKTRAES